MKVVIWAGGYGTRIGEETQLRPKPMIEIGGKPILWHIMKIYSAYGFKDFIICAGYKQHIVKEFFANYYLHTSDVCFDICKNSMETLNNYADDWKVTIIDTGLNTMTGGRVKRVREYLGDEPFLLTYGDGVGDVNIKELVTFHKSHRKIATMTTVNIGQRFGVLEIDESSQINCFREKQGNEDARYINGGFMVMNPGVFDYIDGDATVFEKESLANLAADGQLMAFPHKGKWMCMDTQREKEELEALWMAGDAFWKIW